MKPFILLFFLFIQTSQAQVLTANLKPVIFDQLLLGNAHFKSAKVELHKSIARAFLFIHHDSLEIPNPLVFIFKIGNILQGSCQTQIYVAKVDERMNGGGRKYFQINDNSKATCDNDTLYAPTEVTLMFKPQDYPKGHTMYFKFYGKALLPRPSSFLKSTKI